MPISREMRRLREKWQAGRGWPQRLEWLEITGIRGWTGQRVDFQFPIVALVGENGSGKTTILQAAASTYKDPAGNDRFASDFFPDTPFEQIAGATLRFSFRQGQQSQIRTVRKPTDRWRGNPERPARQVEYLDLERTSPVIGRTGISKLLKAGVQEGDHAPFDNDRRGRLSTIIGRSYARAGTSNTSADRRRQLPVVEHGNNRYSAFHQGAGELMVAELVAMDFPNYGMLLVEEIETSLHPRAQRRLMQDLADVARVKELQVIVSTHSPYVLEELPPEARIYIMEGAAGKTIAMGVSPDFAMTRMDEAQHPECDVYVEDRAAATLVSEVLVHVARDTRSRVQIVPYGAASVGQHLGIMIDNDRFPRPSVVFLDGDQDPSAGCQVLPGGNAPERVVFEALAARNWPEISQRVGRAPAETIDALNEALALADHHEWLAHVGNRLVLGTEIIWQAACASWATNCASQADVRAVTQPVEDALPGA